MCDPTLAMVGINAASSFAGIGAQNAASDANAMSAKLAANNEYVQNTRAYIDETRSILQSGMDLVLQGRAAESMALTSSIQSGVQGSSVRALMRDMSFASARNRQRNQQELQGLKSATTTRNEQTSARTKARIESVPRTRFGLGDAVSILAPIPKYGSKTLGINGLGD